MRNQLVGAILIAALLGILIMVVVRCGPRSTPATPGKATTPTRTLTLRTSPTPGGRTTDVPIIPPGGAGTPTPIFVGPQPAPTGIPPAQPTPGTGAPGTTAPLPPPATTPVTAAPPANPPAAAAPTAPVTGATYVVKRGDTLSGIAARYGLKTSDLAKANNITNVSRIFVGQKLIIPGVKSTSATPAPAPRIHVVQRGETLSGIALKYKTTVSAIMTANKLTSTIIRVGQKLTIP